MTSCPNLVVTFDFALELGEGFACQQFVGQRPVDDRRVEKRYAALYGFVQQADALLLVRVLAAVVGHAHHPETECGDLESGPARAERAVRQTAFFHGQCVFSVECGIGGLYLIDCGPNGQRRSYGGRSFQKTAPADSFFSLP